MSPDFIPFARPDLGEAEADAVRKVIVSGQLAGGKTVDAFEAKFADMVGARYAVAVSSCTTGFQIVLDAIGVRNKRVISPTYTFTGPSMIARQLGAHVVLVDNAATEFTPRPTQLIAAADVDARVIMPVHFAGKAMDLRQFVGSYQVVDDAAHALISSDGRRIVGSQGALATVFSFYATKPICTGNGGMVVTDNENLARELRQLRLHGFSRDLRSRYDSAGQAWHYDVEKPGWKVNMTDMAAALGIVQLEKIHDMQERRREIAMTYDAELDGVVHLPYGSGNSLDHAWHLFPIIVPAEDRDRMYENMTRDGIGLSVHFIPLHHHTAWKDYVSLNQPSSGDANRLAFPNADAMFAGELSLPIYSTMTDDQVKRVIESVKRHAPRAQ